MSWRRAVLAAAASVVVAAAVVLLAGEDAAAQDPPGPRQELEQRSSESSLPDNRLCLACHIAEDFRATLPSGEVLELTFDLEAHRASVHGPYDIPCVLCHTDIDGFPHDPFGAPDKRTWVIGVNQACAGCHEAQARQARDNVHAEALGGGNLEAAVCTDCHDAHDAGVPVPHSPEVAQTCGECHGEVYALYAESVHGEALLSGNRDVPTCTDCHGVHDIEGPSLPEFHLFSPQICAECHEDEELMATYGVRADTFDTYLADFHGTTVTLFEALAPGQETNKAVCIDCHGVHSIERADDPSSPTFKENLLATCQRCHPGATANFPDSWLGHYTPSPSNAVVVWLVDWFYRLVIPIVIGSMAAYVVALTYRRRRAATGVDHG